MSKLSYPEMCIDDVLVFGLELTLVCKYETDQINYLCSFLMYHQLAIFRYVYIYYLLLIHLLPIHLLFSKIHNELKREKYSNFKCVFGWLHDYIED